MVETISILIGFVVGSLPVGLWYGKATKGIDIREYGSGNIGTANVQRTLGGKAALVVLLLDATKGALGPLVAALGHGAPWSPALAGVAAVAGHCWSPFLGFSGGRGIATGLGVVLVLDWRVGLTCLAVWFVTVATTRYVSLGSILAAVCWPFVWALYEFGFGCQPVAGHKWAGLAAGLAIAAVAVIRHLPNIRRLIRRTEPKLGQKARPHADHVAGEEPGQAQDSTNESR